MNTTIEEFEKWLLAQEKPPVKGEMTLGKINEYRTHMCRHAFEGGFNAGQALLSQGELIPIAVVRGQDGLPDPFGNCQREKYIQALYPHILPSEGTQLYAKPIFKIKAELLTTKTVTPSTESLQKELEDLKLDIANYVSLNSSLLKNNVELIAYAKQLRSSFLINMLRNPSCGKSKNEIIDEIDKLNPQPQCMQDK